ncbi:TonB-dependent receptor domain-containing protein [Luteimonas sp. e5]
MFPITRSAISIAVAIALFSAPDIRAQPDTGTLQAKESGAVRGRVLNTATGEYIRNAEIRVEGTSIVVRSEEGGHYRINGVPAGEARVRVRYTGLQDAEQSVTVQPGQVSTLDFAMQSPDYAPSEGTTRLDSVRVTASRSGEAIALMERRAAMNAKHVVPADNYGVLTMGDVGEFMKSMPGISLDYTEVDATQVRIGGLDPKYSTFTMDGARMATATSNNNAGRQNSFEQMSITGIESIELNHTLTASMDADSPAGNINMRSKYAFDRTGRDLIFQLGGVATSNSGFFSRKYFPDDRKHRTVYPSAQVGYGEVFMDGRFGVALNASYNANYVQQDRIQTDWAYYSDGRVLPYRLMWRPGPKMTSRTAVNLSTDFRITDDWTFSLRSAYSHYDVEYFNQYTYLHIGTTGTSWATPDSTPTRIVVNPIGQGSGSPRLQTGYSHRYAGTPAITFAPKLEFKGESTDITLRGSYSTSEFNFRDSSKGFLQATNSWLTRLGFIAERESEDSTAWYLTQTAGRDWSDPGNWGLDDPIGNNIRNNQSDARNRQLGFNLDVKKELDFGALPVTFMTGLATRRNQWQTNESHFQQYAYVGPTGVQTAPSAVVPWTQKYRFHFENLDAGNMHDQNWRADSNYAMYEIFKAHPEWFVPDTLGNLKRVFDNNRLIRETINAAYLQGQTHWGKTRFDLGLRYEKTKSAARVAAIRPVSEVEEAGLSVGTLEGLCYQYRCVDGMPTYTTRKGSYDNFFLSGGVKYDFTRQLVGQLSFSQSILRPDYGNIGGVVGINDNTMIVTVPNAELKPEQSTKYFAGLQYYLEPAGVVGLSYYRLDVRDMQATGFTVNPEDVGFDPAEYPGYEFRSAGNIPGTSRNEGLILEYSQQLTFLPGVLKGLSLRGSYTHIRPDGPRVNTPEKVANWGLGYSHGRFDFQVNGTYQDSYRISGLNNKPTTANNGILYRAAREMWNVSLSYKLSDHFDLQIAGRNVFNEPDIIYSNVRSRVQRHDSYGSMWNFGIRGQF